MATLLQNDLNPEMAALGKEQALLITYRALSWKYLEPV